MIGTVDVLLLLCLLVNVRAGEIKEDFETFISSLPRDSLKEEISVQTSLFELLNSYREHRDELFPYDRFHPNEHYGDYGEYHALEAEVNVGVVFLGFPENAIPRVRDLFFNDLERRDHLHLGEQQARHVHVSASPGSAVLNHQFHVVDTSFRADEVIRRYMRLLLRPRHQLEVGSDPSSSSSSSSSHYYINVWEVEEALESLNWHMQHHLNENNVKKKKRPSLTMFIMNLNLDLDLGINVDIDLNINPDMDIDPKRFDSNTHKYSYSYRNGFSAADLDQIRRNSSCLQQAKLLLKEKNEMSEMSRRVFEHEKGTHVASLHRDFNSLEELESSLTPPPDTDVPPEEDEAWNQYYSDEPAGDEAGKTEEPPFNDHFRLNEVHASKAWARGWSDDYLKEAAETMSLEARVLRMLRCSDEKSSLSSYRFDLARDIVLGQPDDLDNGGDEDNPGVSWVGSSGVAWLDLIARAGTEGAAAADGAEQGGLGTTLNYRDVSRINSEESGGRGDLSTGGGPAGSGGGAGDTSVFPHKAELHALRHSLHQHHTHCSQLLMHTRRRELEHGQATSDEHLAHEDVLYRLKPLPALEHSGSIAASHKQALVRGHFDPNSFVSDFNLVRSSIKEGMEASHLTSVSAILYLQQGLISAVLELSVRLEVAEEEVAAAGSAHSADDVREYYFELMEFHNQALAEVIEVSNMFVGKGHFSRKGFATKAIHDALATVASSVLELTRLLLSKPVTLLPHLPQLHHHLTVEESIRQRIEREVRVEKTAVAAKTAEAAAAPRNAFALLQELREDALAAAVFRGMSLEHQEALLAQAHQAQTADMGGFGFGSERINRYGDDYERFHRSRDVYRDDVSAAQSAEVLMLQTALSPPLLVPKYIEIEVYVVKMQKSYYPLVERERKGEFATTIKFDPRASFFGDNNGNARSLGFDMGTFMSEVERLKLRNQQMTITVHTIDGEDEPALYLGLAGCRRHRAGLAPGSADEAGGGVSHNVSHYYSADCVWRHLQHTDGADQGVGDKSSMGSDSDLPDTQHLAMFILSIDSLSPHYLDSQEDDELHQAVSFGDSILVIQNKQVSIPCTHDTGVKPLTTVAPVAAASRRARDRVVTSWPGRNPLRAALEAASRVLLGMGALSQRTSMSKRAHAKTHLTPLRVSAFHYSDLELAAAFRTRILRSVDFAEALETATSDDISAVGHEYIPELYVYLNSYTVKALQELDSLNWETAAVLANMLVKIAWRKRRHFDAFVHRQRCLNNHKKSFDLLQLPSSVEHGRFGGGYGDDDYMYRYGFDHHGGLGDTEDEVLVERDLSSKSLLWICVLLAFKVVLVTLCAGGLSYAFFFVFSRVLKNYFADKSQIL